MSKVYGVGVKTFVVLLSCWTEGESWGFYTLWGWGWEESVSAPKTEKPAEEEVLVSVVRRQTVTSVYFIFFK